MSSIKSAAILVAAGQGERLAGSTGGIPKQFIQLNETPLFIWSLTTLAKHSAIEQILVAVPNDWQQKAARLIAEFLPDLKQKITPIVGGNSRQQSVYLALEKMASAENLPSYVFVHDAVRPFITSDILDQILIELEKSDAVTVGIPLSDSIKEVANNLVIEDLDRRKFVLVQTPQAARFSLMLAAHRDAILKQSENTDDASIIKAYGATVKVIAGGKLNFKVTETEDLVIAQSLIKYYNWVAGKIKIPI